MTEAEWLACDNPKGMLSFLGHQGRASERKLRLFSCACCRRVWHLIANQDARRAIEVAEAYADGLANDEEREQSQRAANLHELGGTAAKWAAAAVARTGAMVVVDAAGQTAACPPGQEYDPGKWQVEWHNQCGLLRDIFGPLPFRPVTIAPPCLGWNDRTVPVLARIIYDESRFHDLPILADALEDAGCTNEDILTHCRSPGPHIRGCWVVDLLLGKT